MDSSRRAATVAVAAVAILGLLACNFASEMLEGALATPTAQSIDGTAEPARTQAATATAAEPTAAGPENAAPEGLDLVLTDSELYGVDLERGEVTMILSPEDPVEHYVRAYWSPRGDWIALVAQLVAEDDRLLNGLYLVRPDGSELTRLDEGVLDDVQGVSWSPSGERIAVGGRPWGGPTRDIYLADPSAGGVERLTSGAQADFAAWSPDGRRLALSAWTGTHQQLHVLPVEDPGAMAAVTSGPGDTYLAHWSPDGALLAYEYAPEDALGNRDIHVIGSEGQGLTRITQSPVEEAHPRWSPAADRLAYLVEAESFGWHVVLVDPDGSNEVVLTEELLEAEQYPGGASPPVAAWSPDGSRLAVIGDDSSLHVLAADGSGVESVELSLSLPGGPSWAPAP